MHSGLLYLLSMACVMTFSVDIQQTTGIQSDRSHEIFSIQEEVNKIKRDDNPRSRQERADKLAGHLFRNNEDIVDDDVGALSSLLADRDDFVRYSAAMALAQIGPRAREARPALEKAFVEIACVHKDKTSKSGINLALRRMEATPPKVACDPTDYWGMVKPKSDPDMKTQ